MRVASTRVVAVWIFSRIEQQANDFDMSKLRCQRERQMAVVSTSVSNESAEVLDASQSCRDRQIDSSAAPD